MSLNALQPFIKVEDPVVTAFEQASSEQISKEFKEQLDSRQKASLEGVSLDEAPSVSLNREDFLGYGLDDLVKGLSPEALRKKRKEEAKERSKYNPFAGDIFPETPVTSLNALEQEGIAATQLSDPATIQQRQRLDDISLSGDNISLEEGGLGDGPQPENLSWLEQQMGDLRDAFGKVKQARVVGSKVKSFFDPAEPDSFGSQMTPEANLNALNYSGSYGAEYAASLSSTGQAMAARAFDASKGIWGGMGTPTGLAPYHAPATSEMIAANVSKFAPYVLKAAALYFTFKGGIPQTNEGKIDAAVATYAIFTGNPIAVGYSAFKGLVGWIESRKGKPKFAKGGADMAFENGYFKATSGYGYNGYKREAGQAGAAATADYLNTFKDYFGLKFYKPAYDKALAEDSRLGRYENINESGYADPTVMIRTLMETKGFMQGAPSIDGKPIQDQKQYESAMAKFNKHYSKKAMERGGLYNAKKAGIMQELSKDGVPDQITFRNSTQTYAPGGGSYETNTTGGGYGGGPATTEVGYWETTGGGHSQQRRWVPAPPGTTVDQGTGTSGSGGSYTTSYHYEDVDNPYDMLYYNLTGQFNRGQEGTNY